MIPADIKLDGANTDAIESVFYDREQLPMVHDKQDRTTTLYVGSAHGLTGHAGERELSFHLKDGTFYTYVINVREKPKTKNE